MACSSKSHPLQISTIMPATPADLFAFLDRLAIAHRTVHHPALFTVEQSRALRGQIPGGHTKNLFLKDKSVRSISWWRWRTRRSHLKTLHHRLGTGRFSFGSPDVMRGAAGRRTGLGHARSPPSMTPRPSNRTRRRHDGA